MFNSSFAGLRIIESETATKLPDAKPHTLDMQGMVDHFHRLGLVERRPCAFQMGDTMIIHPSMLAKLKERLARNIRNEADRLTLAAIRGRK